MAAGGAPGREEGTIVSLVRRHPVAAYFALAYAFSWLAWLPLILAARGAIAPLPLSAHYFGAFGPLLSAFAVTAMLSGRAGIRPLIASMFAWRRAPGWVLVGALSPFALFGVAAVMGRAGGAPWPVWADLGRSDDFGAIGLLGLWAIETLTFGFGEETGWRGFALPRLQRNHSAFSATVLLTLGWIVWHLPSFLYRPGYQMNFATFTGWATGLFAGAIVATWLFNSSRGSVLAVALWHGALDVVYLSRAGQGQMAVNSSIVFMVWAILVLMIAGPRYLTRRREKTVAPFTPNASAAPRGAA